MVYIRGMKPVVMEFIVSSQIWKDDGLPESICAKCVSRLHIAFQFKKTCEKSDARLRNYLENVIANKDKMCQEVEVCWIPKR